MMGKILFTLVVDRKGKKVFWRGRKEGKMKEKITNFTDTEIKMTWKTIRALILNLF